MTADLNGLIGLMKAAQETGKTISQEDIRYEFGMKIILLTDEYLHARKLSPQEVLICIAKILSAEIAALSTNKAAAITTTLVLCDIIMKTILNLEER